MGLLGDGANQRICGFRFQEGVNITANLFALLFEFHNAFQRLEHQLPRGQELLASDEQLDGVVEVYLVVLLGDHLEEDVLIHLKHQFLERLKGFLID